MLPIYDDIESTVMRVLSQQGTLISRRTLERHVVNAGATPAQFTNAVERLVTTERIHLVPISVANCPDCKFFSLSPPTESEIADAKAIYAERIASFNGKTLGSIGEQYARALFAKARKRGANWFQNVPRKKRLGHLPLPGGAGEADLIIALDTRIFEMNALLVEVKNAFEAYAVGSPIFSKLLRQSLAAGLQPALLTPRLSPDAALFCQQMGIALLVLGKQIVSSDLMLRCRELWGREGARDGFQPFNPKHPFPGHQRDDLGRSEAHVQVISDFVWLQLSHSQWIANQAVLPRVLDALEIGDRALLKSLREEAASTAPRAA